MREQGKRNILRPALSNAGTVLPLWCQRAVYLLGKETCTLLKILPALLAEKGEKPCLERYVAVAMLR
jgi:hypothetical protein